MQNTTVAATRVAPPMSTNTNANNNLYIHLTNVSSNPPVPSQVPNNNILRTLNNINPAAISGTAVRQTRKNRINNQNTNIETSNSVETTNHIESSTSRSSSRRNENVARRCVTRQQTNAARRASTRNTSERNTNNSRRVRAEAQNLANSQETERESNRRTAQATTVTSSNSTTSSNTAEEQAAETTTTTTTTTTTSNTNIPPSRTESPNNVIVYNILSGMKLVSPENVHKERKVNDHCGTLRTFTVFFTFKFNNLLDKIFLREFRHQLILAADQAMPNIVTINSDRGKYYIAEREKTPHYKYKVLQLLERFRGVTGVKTYLNLCVIKNRYILSHVRRVPQSTTNSSLHGLLSTFRPFTSRISMETATPSEISELQAQQLMFYQMQQHFRDRVEQEQFRNRFEQRQSLAELLPSSEAPEMQTQRGGGTEPAEQAKAHYRTFMEMNAPTACLVDMFQEKEYTIKMSNHCLSTLNMAYWKLEMASELSKSAHYGHSLVRKPLQIVPYVNSCLETNYKRCFIVINPMAVSPEELLMMHGQDLSANNIDIGKNIPGCAIEDLHSYLRRRGYLNEQEALNLFHQMCETVRVCHHNGIILRDLKLKRFFFIDEERKRIQYESLEGAMILPDPHNDMLHEKIGCPLYTAPELLVPDPSYHGKPADMWSLGIILYTMLVGQYPFFERRRCSLINVIRICNPYMPTTWSHPLRHLMHVLLDKQYTNRPTIDQIFHTHLLKTVKPDWMNISMNDLIAQFPISDNEDDEEEVKDSSVAKKLRLS